MGARSASARQTRGRGRRKRRSQTTTTTTTKRLCVERARQGGGPPLACHASGRGQSAGRHAPRRRVDIGLHGSLFPFFFSIGRVETICENKKDESAAPLGKRSARFKGQGATKGRKKKKRKEREAEVGRWAFALGTRVFFALGRRCRLYHGTVCPSPLRTAQQK